MIFFLRIALLGLVIWGSGTIYLGVTIEGGTEDKQKALNIIGAITIVGGILGWLMTGMIGF
jgi:membrane protein DedA with SNARE-associated domain